MPTPAPAGLWADVNGLESPTSPNAVEALQASSYLLWVLSGRRWSGLRTVTEEYSCRNGVSCCGGWCSSVQEIRLGVDHVARLFHDEDWGSREGQRVLPLRQRPAREIISLRRTTGSYEELDPADYAIYDYAFLAPAGPNCCDPCFDPCCMEVTYTWGSPPPPLGVTAALDLANEFVKAIECPDECQLPERITSVSRQGVSFQVFDAQDFLNDGRVGIYSVDVFLKAVNPDRAQKRARVFSPDMMKVRRRTSSVPAIEPFGGRH